MNKRPIKHLVKKEKLGENDRNKHQFNKKKPSYKNKTR